MHHTCVTPPGPGEELQCPICKSEVKLEEARASSSIPPGESANSDLPYWHEVGIGAPATKRKGRAGSKPLPPQERRAPFPQDRWPSEEEADLHGFRSVKDWYINYRKAEAKRVDAVASDAGRQDQSLDPVAVKRIEADFEEQRN